MKTGTGSAAALGLLAAISCAGAACRGSRPVGRLAVTPTRITVATPLAVPLALRWTPESLLDGVVGKPRVFVHVLDGARRIQRTFDHPLPEVWTPGREQTYEIEVFLSAIGDPLPAGAYEMTFGLYDDRGRERWPLAVDGEEVGRREYRLATLVVDPERGPAPAFGFTGGWMPVEPGPSKQVVARRCLRGEGRIGVESPPESGTVRLAASTVTGSPSPWTVTSGCSPATASVSGPELRWASFPVAATPAAPACEILFTPPASAAPPALCLEVLAWRPGTP
jgi:hypothetical protein